MGEVGNSLEAVTTREAPTSGRVQPTRGQVMDRLREFLDVVKERGQAPGNFLGLLHVLIGRKITLADGTEVSAGLTWRDAAALLKKLRWDREAVREIGLNPDDLPPRDRERFWYLAIMRAHVDSPAALAAGEQVADSMRAAGYVIGPAPHG